MALPVSVWKALIQTVSYDIYVKDYSRSGKTQYNELPIIGGSRSDLYYFSSDTQEISVTFWVEGATALAAFKRAAKENLQIALVTDISQYNDVYKIASISGARLSSISRQDKIHFLTMRLRRDESLFGVANTITQEYVPPYLLTSLVSWWELGEASGTRVDSVTATGNDLTDNNTVLSATGKVGDGADHEQANSEYLSRASGASLQTGDIDISGCAWVNIESVSAGFNPAIFKKGANTSREYMLRILAATPAFEFLVSSDGTTATTLTHGTTLSLATWYFVWFKHDSAADLIYLGVNDGAAVSVAHVGGMIAAGGDFKTAWNDWTDTGIFDGVIDQMGFWKRMITDAEIAALYNGGAGVAFADLPG